MGTMHPKGPIPSLLDLAGDIMGYPVRDGQSSMLVIPLPPYIIPSDQPLVPLPEETDLVALSPPLLRVHSQEKQLFPVVLP